MKSLILAVALACACGASAMAQGGKNLELQEVVKGDFSPRNIYGVTPIPGDGEHYTQMNAAHTQIIKYSFKTGKQVEVLFDVATARGCTFKRFDSYTFAPDGQKLLIATETNAIYRRSATAVYWLYSLKRNSNGQILNQVERLSDGGPQQSPVFSPDGNMVAFVRDNNIFLVKLLYNNSESQVTDDGRRNEVINGIPDWVYEEEFGFATAMAFSADSRMLAFLRFDESQVQEYSFPVFRGEAPQYGQYAKYPGAYTYKYPKTGEANSRVEVRTFDISSRVTRTMQVPLDADGYIPRIYFTNEPDQLAILTLNRHQNRLDIYMGNVRSTVCKLILREESDTYIKEESLDGIKFYGQNFSFLSDRSGFNHLYWYTTAGTLVKQVTGGNWEVTDFYGYAAGEDAFYYQSNEESPLQKAVYKIDRRGRKSKLSANAGTNSAQFSSDMKYSLNRYSSLTVPTVITLNDNSGKVLTTLVDNAELRQKMSAYSMPTKEFFSFTTSRGDKLNGIIMRPADFSAGRKYPVLLYQYSGPGSQRVLDQFSVSWETYMAGQGFILVCVDGRGTGGRGAAFEKQTYMNLGVKEAQDQVAAAQYMASQPYVDKDRIGIWGWSYGGYMTLMSMSEGTPVFRAGVAVAPVTDWNYYDTVYGERYMRTPKENAGGYDASSCFSRADKLNGRLLLIHGMADDNVHFQNAAEYAERLVQAGKQFEMQVYTNRNHSIRGGNTSMHLYTRITDFFKRELQGN